MKIQAAVKSVRYPGALQIVIGVPRVPDAAIRVLASARLGALHAPARLGSSV